MSSTLKTGERHLIKCRCVLPQFKNSPSPPDHHFAVFTVIAEDGEVVPHFAQCPNCGIIHRVIDICKSEVVAKREDMQSLRAIDDVKPAIPPALAAALERADADLPTWEAVEFCIENERWGTAITLTSDVEGSTRVGKFVRIISPTLFKVESFTRAEHVVRS